MFCVEKISFIRCLGEFDAGIIHFLRRSVEKTPKNVEKTVVSVEKIGRNFFSTLLNVLIISVSVEV